MNYKQFKVLSLCLIIRFVHYKTIPVQVILGQFASEEALIIVARKNVKTSSCFLALANRHSFCFHYYCSLVSVNCFQTFHSIDTKTPRSSDITCATVGYARRPTFDFYPSETTLRSCRCYRISVCRVYVLIMLKQIQ